MRMPKSWKSLFLIALTLLSLAGCKKEGCTDPLSTNFDPEAKVDDGSCTYTASTLTLQVTHKVGNAPFAFNTPYQDADGRSYQFRTARFHVSSPRLLSSAGGSPIDTYVQVTGSQSTYNLGEVAPGAYQGLSFDVGVDSATNHGDPTLFPAAHPLSIFNSNQDHWSWNSGYVFLKIEGYVDTTATMNGPMNKFFFFHMATDPLLTGVTLTRDFSIPSGTGHTFSIVIDWEKALAGVDLQRQSTQTSDNFPLAQQMMQNFVTGITID